MEIAEIQGEDLEFVAEVVQRAIEQGQSVRFTVQGGGLSVSRAQSMWCAPLGR